MNTCPHCGKGLVKCSSCGTFHHGMLLSGGFYGDPTLCPACRSTLHSTNWSILK